MQLAEEKNHTAIVQYLKAYKKTLQTLTVEQSGTVPNQDVTSHYNLSPEGNDNGGAKFSAEKDKSQTAPDDAVKSDQAETFDTLSSEVAKMNIDGSNHSQTGPQIDDKVIKEKDIKKNWTLEQKQNLVKTCVSRFFLGGKYCYGKTSLARSLLHNKGITTEEDERTEVLEFNPWRIDENTTVTMYDLGGHQCYQNLSHIFHCDEKNNFTLLPHQINDKDYSTTCNWINDVISRSPISVIHFILTKSDLLPKDKHNQAKEDFKNHVIQFLKNQMKQIESKLKEKDHKQDKILKKDTNEKLKKLKKIREKYKSLVEDLTHEKILDVVSCKTGEGLSEFRGKIVKIVKTQEFKIDIPKTAHLLYQRLGKLGIEGVKERKALLSVKTLISEVKQNESDEKQGSGESRDAIPKKKEPSSSDTKDEIPTEENKLTSEKEPRKEEYLQYVSFEDAKLELKNLLPASKSDGEITNDLVDYLSLLNCHGLLLWYNTDGLKELIFNDLYSLIQMLKTLFQHSFQENYKTETSEKPESSFDFKKLSEEQQVFLRKERITKTKYNNLLNHLKNQGVLSNLLLKILVKKFHFEDHLGELIHMLDHLGIAYSIPSEKDESDIANRDIFFPWYISQSVAPEDILIKMKEDSKYNFLLKVTVAGTFPSAFFNCLAVRIYKLLVPNDLRQTLEIWQDHIFAWVNKNRVYLEYIKSPNDDKIDIHIVCPFSITSIQESWDFIDNCLKVIDCLNDEWWDGVLNDMYLQCACRHCDRTLVPGRWDILQHLKEKCSESVYQCPNNRTENLPIAFLFPLPQDKYEAQNFVSEAEQYLKNHGHPYTLDESLKKHQADQQYGEREGSSGDEVDKTRKVSKAVEEMKSQNLLSDSRGKGLFAHNAHLKLSKSDFENVLYLMQYVCAVEYSTSEGTGNGTGILLGFVEPKDPGSTVQLSSLINPSVTTNILYAQSNITSQKGAQSGSSTALFHLPTALPVITTKVAVILTSGHILTKWNPNVQQGKLTFDWYKMYGGKVMESNCSGVIAVGDELLDYALLFTSDKNVISRFQNLVQSRPKKLATSSTPPSPNSKMILLGHPKHSFMQGDFIEILDKKSKKDCEKGTNVEWVDRDCSVIYNCCSFHGTSGAPCFKLNDDNNVELVCIHTGGIYLNQSDPKEHDKSDFEFGILVSPILDDINKKLPTLGLKWAIID